ncbi:MAG: acyl-CoA dehydratase activase [Burkholderiales bacterium]
MSKHCSLGLDVGSVSTNLVLLDEEDSVIEKIYLRTSGRPIDAILKGLSALAAAHRGAAITAVGATGSGRQLASAIVGADIIKNEITAHAAAACRMVPEVRTIIEIGGQDSKIIFLNDGIVTGFAMNTVCAAGTGSFLDRQASRLEIPIEEFGSYAVRSKCPVRIAGRCAVFAESDMISKQQAGHSNEDIIAGLCEALVRNFLNNLAKNKEIPEPIVFQGGVAANVGMSAAFERALGKSVIIPRYYDVMGAIGAALLAREEIRNSGRKTNFYGFGCVNNDYTSSNFECSGCTNLCEVVQIRQNGLPVANWGDRCGKWSSAGYKVIMK